MRTIKYLTIVTLLLSICVGCQERELIDLTETLSNIPDDEIEIIARSPSMPDVNGRHRPLIVESRASSETGALICNSEKLLGSTYKAGNGIIGDYANVGFQIIDIEKVKALGNNRISSHYLNDKVTDKFTFSDFEHFTDSSSITKKISHGFSLNLGLFKIGRKKTTTEVFKSAYTSSNQSVYGELDILIRDSRFTLDCVSSSRRIYARQCLTKEFKEALYGSTIGEIINQYGPYVLIGYDTGGKALALYAAKTKAGASYSLHEKDLQDSITASFTWNNDSSSVSASLKFKLNNGHVSTSQSSIKNTMVQIRTYGGRNYDNAIVGPIDLKNLSVDLSSWQSSLSDVNTHTMINITDEGLMPLSAFVLEENFQYRFDDTACDYLESLTDFTEPHIEVLRVYARSAEGQRLYEIAPVLVTRQGDYIVLSDGKYKQMSNEQLKQNSDNDYYRSCLSGIAAQKKEYFNGIRYIGLEKTWLDPRDRDPVCIRLDNFDETKAYKFIADGNMGYIYMPEAKVALSYYISEWDEDAVLDDYGIRDWVENLPEKKIAISSLANYYTIIGL